MHKNHPAFPVADSPDTFQGMDLRTYIATQIMASAMGQTNAGWARDSYQESAAKAAVQGADALIRELSK